MKPIIGITPSPIRDAQAHGTFTRYALSDNYVNAVLAGGGTPLILPPQDDNAPLLLDHIDGLLLSGGADIDPAVYGDTTIHPKTYDISPLRDRFEFALLAGALERDLPVLGICRGIQVLNVALGGTLYQDVPDQTASDLQHRQQENGIAASEPSHAVDVSDGSHLSQVYGAATLQTNSFHHQAIKDLAPTLIANGRTGDGLIESVSLPDRTWVLAVQWHPEMMFVRHDEHLRPFAALVNAATVHSLTASRI